MKIGLTLTRTIIVATAFLTAAAVLATITAANRAVEKALLYSAMSAAGMAVVIILAFVKGTREKQIREPEAHDAVSKQLLRELVQALATVVLLGTAVVLFGGVSAFELSASVAHYVLFTLLLGGVIVRHVFESPPED